MDIQSLDHKTLNDEIQAAVKAHDEWNRRLTTAINLGSCETAPADIAVDHKCAFGQWLYTPEVSEQLKDGKPYQVVQRLHADFHECAARVATLAEKGHKSEAYALLDGEYSQKSSKLLRALTKWRGEIAP